MDNICHACVGNSLSHNHHNGRFFPTTHLGPYRVSLILEKVAFQNPMKCKDRDLVWEDGSPHGRSTKMKRRRNHPQVIEWMWLMSKELGGYLQIYDTGQQEAWLRWLLLKEFGPHPLSKGMWLDTFIFEQ